MFKLSKRYIHLGAKDVVAHCLHQGEEAEAHCDGNDQGAGSLQGLGLLWLDFTQESLQKGVFVLFLFKQEWKTEST